MLKKLKSLFVVDDEEFKRRMSGEEEAGADGAQVADAKAESSPELEPIAPVQAGPGQVSDKFLNVLLGALEKANLEGFDYLEFKNSLKSLQKMDMDDATRYKSAFALAQTMNATPDHLIKTAGHYLSALEEEEAKFGQALSNQKAKQVEGKKTERANLDKTIRQKAEQIKKLSNEIEQHQAQLEKLEQDIVNASAKVANTQANFMASYQAVVGQIKADIEKMKQYLK